MMDGLELGKMTILAAMGIDCDGRKHMLGIIEGGSENTTVVKGLLDDLIGRGLDPSRPRLYVLDGGKALHKGVTDVFGKEALIQRCQVHKKRNVLSYLPKSEQINISKALTMAYREFEYTNAKDKLLSIAKRLEHRYPKAATSLSEGLEETLTVHRLKVPGLLREPYAAPTQWNQLTPLAEALFAECPILKMRNGFTTCSCWFHGGRTRIPPCKRLQEHGSANGNA